MNSNAETQVPPEEVEAAGEPPHMVMTHLYRYTWGARLERCPDGVSFRDFASEADALAYARRRDWSVRLP